MFPVVRMRTVTCRRTSTTTYMKNISWVAAFALLPGALLAQENQQKVRVHLVQINAPIHLLDHNTVESYFLYNITLAASYQQRLSRAWCPFVQLAYQGPTSTDTETAEAKEAISTTGFSVSAGNRFYQGGGTEPTGYYWIPMLRYGSARLNETTTAPDGHIQLTDIGAIGAFGYQQVWQGGLSCNVELGVHWFDRHYYDSTLLESAAVIDHRENGVAPHVAIRVGFAF
jgi:hypothetical protein